MSKRRTIGISLACLVTGACAIDKTPEEESMSHYPGHSSTPPVRGQRNVRRFDEGYLGF